MIIKCYDYINIIFDFFLCHLFRSRLKYNDNMIVDMDSLYQLPIISLLHPPKPIG